MSATSPLWMPAAERDSAPFTGYTRAHWIAAADRLLDAARTRSTDGGALVDFGAGSSRMDRLEGFARTFLLAAIRIAGDPRGTAALVAHYAAALHHAVAHGVWPRLRDHDQATVEAASVAIGLHLTRDTLWPALDDRTRLGLHAWFEQARGTWCADNNHVLLGATLAAFNHAEGYSDGRDAVENALDRIDDWYRGDGWYTDGDGRRFDHYNGYAFHWYPLFIDRIMGAPLGDRRAVHRERLAAFVDGYQHLFDARCAPVFLGRSLIYRWAVAAPLWMARWEGLDTIPASRTRRLASGVLKHYVDGGALDDGTLSLGWQSAPLPSIVQSYSGAGSPYWAAKGFLGLALPATDAVWNDTETPTAIETGDVRRILAGPRWVVDARQQDGIVRLHNLGSDGHPTVDDPLYRRLLFTSATRPLPATAISSASASAAAPVVARDSDFTIEGATHRPAVRATAGARGGAVTRTLDAGGRHVLVRVAARILDTRTLYAARVSGAVGLRGRVSAAAVTADAAASGADAAAAGVDAAAAVTADATVSGVDAAAAGVNAAAAPSGPAHAVVRGARLSAASGDEPLISEVRLLGAWEAAPSSSPVPVPLESEGVVDRIPDGDEMLLCPAVRLGTLPADLIVVWQTSLGTRPAAPLTVGDVLTHDDHVVLSVDGERHTFRWSLSESFPADTEAQLIRRP